MSECRSEKDAALWCVTHKAGMLVVGGPECAEVIKHKLESTQRDARRYAESSDRWATECARQRARATDAERQNDALRTALCQAKQYIAHDQIAHAMRKKPDGEYELSFDPGCRRCGWDNVVVMHPKGAEYDAAPRNCCMCGALVERLYSERCPSCYDKLVSGQGREP